MFEKKVLDLGFVRLLNISGAVRRTLPEGYNLSENVCELDTPERDFDAIDTDPALVARTSFARGMLESSKAIDEGLVEYLVRNEHTTPLEFTTVYLEFKMPIFCARQVIRHRTGNLADNNTGNEPTVNEVSGRYVTLPNDWYIPEVVRGKHSGGNKQGSEDNLPVIAQQIFKNMLNNTCKQSYAAYEDSLREGVCPEQARMFLHLNHYCVHVDTPILTQDLRWVNAGELKKGDKLLAFEEYGKDRKSKRRLVPSYVTEFSIQEDELYTIELSNGDKLTCNAEHKWLVRYATGGGSVWKSTRELMLNPTQWELPKLLDTWETDTSYNAGFLSASFDGEGYLTYTTGKGKALGFTQNENPMLDKVRELLVEEGYEWSEQTNKVSGTKNLRLLGGLGTILKFLGTTRPPRILDKWLKDTDGGLFCKELTRIVSITPCGIGKIASMSTSSKTYIANGYASHNTQFVWKQDLHNLMHFLSLRLDEHAQWEVRQYAEAIYELLKEHLPKSMEWFDTYRRKLTVEEKELLVKMLIDFPSYYPEYTEVLTKLAKRQGLKV